MTQLAVDKRESISKEAEWYFIKKGYHNTQISDIAKSAGIAVGSIYKIFTGKKALFQYVVLRIFEKTDAMDIESNPIKEISDEQFNQILEEKLSFYFSESLPQLSESESFKSFLSVIFDTINSYGAAFLIFERNSLDFEKSCNIYYKHRLTFLKHFELCMKKYQDKGEIRPLENLQQHARLVVETMSFWGMHIKYDIGDISVSEETSKQVVLDSMLHAYLVQA